MRFIAALTATRRTLRRLKPENRQRTESSNQMSTLGSDIDITIQIL
ncbi:MAG: hypothetical protein RBT76_08565 [candidate division Zixibacteria bacterium]|nr:hypothetical protein [candidate division Zixibacteria bacterium]